MSEDDFELDVEKQARPEAEMAQKARPSAERKPERVSLPTIRRSAPAPPPVQPPPQAPPQTLTVDDSAVTTHYANFCRISSTPEELILDLGLNPSPMSPGKANVAITERIILNHYTAKRLLSALAATLHQHERVFGTLETDVRRRLQGS